MPPRAPLASPRLTTGRACTRVFLTTAAVLAATATLAPALWAQQQGQARRPTLVSQTVTTDDGWRLPLSYYPVNERDAAVVVLLHPRGDSRLVWERNGLAEYLHQGGLAVITVDLRKHGEAKDASGGGAGEPGPRDYTGMVRDLEAVKQFIFDEHQKQNLNMAKTTLVAAGMSGPVALVWASVDWLKRPFTDAPTVAASTPRGQDVKAIVLLSPEDNLPGLNVSRALGTFRDPRVNCAILICYGDKASGDDRAARELHRQLTSRRGGEKQILIKGFDTPLRGTDLIGRNLQIEPLIRGFLIEHGQKLDIPWRDRRSRLQRLD